MKSVFLPRLLLVTVFGFLCGPSHGQVVSSADNGFDIAFEQQVKALPAQTYQQFLAIGQWWSNDHSWFGDATKMRLEPRLGGCFCEINGRRVARHMTVTYVDPGRELRMVGGLGPLQMMGVSGGMAWRFTPNDQGTLIELHYQVSGYTQTGLGSLAPTVEQVLAEQLDKLTQRLRAESK